MIERIVAFSVRRAGLVVALALALLGLGLARLGAAHLDVFPEFAPTQVVIQTEAPGYTASWVESLVTLPIEQSLAGLADVQSLRSQSLAGLSVVTLIFNEGSDLLRHRQAVVERLAQLGSQLPPGVQASLTPLTSSASTVLGVGLTSTRLDPIALRGLVEQGLRPHLLAVPGVADVNVFGGALPQWQIELRPQALVRSGISAADVATSLRASLAVRALVPIGTANQQFGLTLAPPADVADPAGALEAQLMLPSGAGAPPRALGELAHIRQVAQPGVNAAQIDGEVGIFLMVQGQLGANTREVTLALERKLAELAPGITAQGATLRPDLFRPASFIDTAVHNVRNDVAIGAGLVVAVLFVFLYNVRTAVISALAIPLSLLAALAVLQAAGMSINIMVLGGLAIALGEVVDDAIIDCENIFRRLRENSTAGSPRQVLTVVIGAALEVRSSVVYATFIVALVFVPLLALQGVAGKLFAPLGLAYITATLASLAVALTFTPALSALLLARASLRSADPPLIAWLQPRYRRLLLAVERHAVAVLVVGGALMALGIGVLPLLSGEFIPPLKEGHYVLHMTALPGTSLDESLRSGLKVTEQLRKIEGVRSVAQWVGRARNGADTFGPHYSEFEIEIGQVDGASQQRILANIRRNLSGDDGDADTSDEAAIQGKDDDAPAGFPGMQFSVNTFLTERIGETVSGYPADIVVNLFGPSLDELDRDARALALVLARTPGTRDVALLAPPGAPELEIRLRSDRLARYGLAADQVLDAVQLAAGGLHLGEVRAQPGAGAVPGSLAAVPVLLSLPLPAGDPMALTHLPVTGGHGEQLHLRDLADLSLGEGRHKILHDAGRRVQTLTANLQRGSDAEVVARDLRARIGQALKLAPGNQLEITGAAEAQQQARGELVRAALAAGVGVAALLWLAFGSMRKLALTFVNLPFALIGGVVAVLATGAWMTLGSLVGFVTLFGITLRNAIMLVSHYQHLVEADGRPWNLDTAVQGALERLPSIVMTALVTALGLAPLALGSGEPGREIEGPMAIIIVGGLVSSTLLNLLILPTVMLRWGCFGAEPGRVEPQDLGHRPPPGDTHAASH
jgi:CzcA family heavy metal efflux pump